MSLKPLLYEPTEFNQESGTSDQIDLNVSMLSKVERFEDIEVAISSLKSGERLLVGRGPQPIQTGDKTLQINSHWASRISGIFERSNDTLSLHCNSPRFPPRIILEKGGSLIITNEKTILHPKNIVLFAPGCLFVVPEFT
jgi:hypothetical protein